MIKLNKENIMQKIGEFPFQDLIGEFRVETETDVFMYLYLYTDGMEIIEDRKGQHRTYLSETFEELHKWWSNTDPHKLIYGGIGTTFPAYVVNFISKNLGTLTDDFKPRILTMKHKNGRYVKIGTVSEFTSMIYNHMREEWE